MEGLSDIIFSEVMDCIIPCIDVDRQDFSFSYEKQGFIIDGCGRVDGEWIRRGDGYFEPIEYYLRDVCVNVIELSIFYFDETINEEIEYADDVVSLFKERLNIYLESYLRGY